MGRGTTSGEGGKSADGICQLLNQACRQGGLGPGTLAANSLPTKFWKRLGRAKGMAW